MGGVDLDRWQDRLHDRNAAPLVPRGGEPQRIFIRAPAAQSSDDKAWLELLEREVKELRRANEILRKTSAYFAQGEDRAAPLQAMPERSTAAKNGDGLHRGSSQGHGYRADLPRTGTRPSLAAHRPGTNMLPALLMPASGQRVPRAMTR